MSSSLRLAARNVFRAPASIRSFSKVSVARADIVTDMYLKNLKEFKPTPAKESDAEGQVKHWCAPAPPKAPESASNVESELSTYASSEVESATADGSSQAAAADNEGDWFELDTAPDHAHH